MKTDAQLERDATSLGHDLADDITALGKVNLSADDANDATKREQVKTYINRLLEKQLT